MDGLKTIIRSEQQMLKSSLGFHTMTLDMSLLEADTNKLLLDFMEYGKTTALKMYRYKDGKYITYYPSPDYLPTDVRIYFDGRDKGIHWHIYSDDRFSSMVYIIEAIINPKILGNTIDYLTASTFEDINIAAVNFNRESHKISSLLGTFNNYRIKRIDYCINICLDDFIPVYDPEQIMNLIKRSDIPPHYKEWMEYDSTSHRKKSRPESLYLCSKSVNINYYSKYMQLLNRSQENVEKGYAPIPREIIDASRSIIRFEVQFKYFKTYTLSKNAEDAGNHDCNKYKNLLHPVECIRNVSDYYIKVIGKGDWYTLHEAIRIIQSKNFNSQRQKRLIDALLLVSQARSLARAKASLQGYGLAVFKKTLKELSDLGINPVTIPREWGIRHVPNLLRIYFDRLCLECSNHGFDEMNFYTYDGYLNYCKIYGHPPI